MGLLPLTYRRPQLVDKEKFRKSVSSDNSSENGHVSFDSEESGVSAGVPEALTFDKIITGGTCPPMTIRDFMNYLIYIEHSAENLQFFLWYRDYVKRFDEAHTSDKPLAPEWTQAMAEETLARIKKDAAEKRKTDPLAVELFKGTDFEGNGGEKIPDNRGPFDTPPRTPGSDDQSTIYSSSQAPTHHSQAHDTFAAVGAKQPFTIQPFRAEIDRVIATYLAADAPRQLNLSNHEHKVTMHALAYTTHPSALRQIAKTTENTLRKQAHPNFVRWSICNGNPARVFFARGLGVGTILLATLGAIILTLSRAGRGYRALFAIGWVLGIATLIAAYKGMCVVLHGMHHRHIRPWELFAGDDDERASTGDSSSASSLAKRSFDTLGSSNSYEDEPWVVRYEKRNVVRKVFDREVWIQEPALRHIQDTIFVQAMGSALVLSAILTAIFVAVPGGHFF